MKRYFLVIIALFIVGRHASSQDFDSPGTPDTVANAADINDPLESNDNHLSGYFNPQDLAAFPDPEFDLANGVFNHRQLRTVRELPVEYCSLTDARRLHAVKN
jgi:hypothetical protein